MFSGKCQNLLGKDKGKNENPLDMDIEKKLNIQLENTVAKREKMFVQRLKQIDLKFEKEVSEKIIKSAGLFFFGRWGTTFGDPRVFWKVDIT